LVRPEPIWSIDMEASAKTASPSTEQATDRRADRRRRTYLDAKVILDNRMSTFDVVVRNRSGIGFFLKTENSALIPDEFSLSLPDGSGEYRCRVVRRGSNYLGAEVIGQKGLPKVEAKPVKHADPNEDLRAKLAARFPHLTKS
jgi:hypothetical protein